MARRSRSRGWDLLARELMAWGAEVVAVDMPTDRQGEGSEFYADEVVKQMPPGEPPIVVAHSSAGLILPVVASRMKVARLIYLAAVIPQPKTSFMDRVKRSPKMFNPDWPGKDPTKSEELARHFLFHDCDESTTRVGDDHAGASGTRGARRPKSARFSKCRTSPRPTFQAFRIARSIQSGGKLRQRLCSE